MSQTAVVILNYNGEKLLRQFLPSVVSSSGQAKIIVADNGSTDQSLSLLKEEFSSVSIIALDKNYGFCGGYNRALKQVDADYYVLLNSDVEVTAGWLSPMIALLDSDASIGAVQPKILAYKQKDSFEYAGAGGGFIDSLGYPFCRGRIFDTLEKDHSQYNDTLPIFWATGACLFIRARLYHQFEGLDEDFFAHMEEIDLCWKLHRDGHKVYYSGASTVYHLGAGTLGYGSPGKTYLNFRNGLSLIHKHLDPGELLYKLPLRLALDWVAAIMYALKGEGAHSWAIMRAHIDFFRRLPANRAKRRRLRAMFPNYSRKTIFSGLVLANYFLLGRKTWTSKYQ
jgi:GT2 family glycosyltransferase